MLHEKLRKHFGFVALQDIIKSPSAEHKTLRKATTFYLLSGCMGYAAFGDNEPVNWFWFWVL